MVTLLRRVFLLALLAGSGYAAWTAWQRRNETAPAAAPQWPPFEPETLAAMPSPGATSPGDDPQPAPDWVEPVDAACPASHPIKANANSMIYHQPGGRFYDRTVPERCYATTEAAERDGFRAAKS